MNLDPVIPSEAIRAASAPLHRGIHGRAGLLLVGDIELDQRDAIGRRIRECAAQRVQVSSCSDDTMACLESCIHDSRSDPATGACNEPYLAHKIPLFFETAGTTSPARKITSRSGAIVA